MDKQRETDKSLTNFLSGPGKEMNGQRDRQEHRQTHRHIQLYTHRRRWINGQTHRQARLSLTNSFIWFLYRSTWPFNLVTCRQHRGREGEGGRG